MIKFDMSKYTREDISQLYDCVLSMQGVLYLDCADSCHECNHSHACDDISHIITLVENLEGIFQTLESGIGLPSEGLEYAKKVAQVDVYKVIKGER